MSLHEVHKGVHKHKQPQRIGRGIGSGKGKTSGKGHKGQIARAGWKALPIFQGGGSPLVRRVPKRGFTNSFALTVAEVNVGDLEELFNAGAEVTPEALENIGYLKKRYDVLKVLGDGELKKKLTVSAHRFSASAKAKIEGAGGSVATLAAKKPASEKSPPKKAPAKTKK
ncbi:MAG TPA: 50S ribosomal protein L15 [Pirellulaceae bacterium]|nr:50S ribosomal protein L15 [Pirellulaceae bacterium]